MAAHPYKIRLFVYTALVTFEDSSWSRHSLLVVAAGFGAAQQAGWHQ
jgi:hypothetical protein